MQSLNVQTSLNDIYEDTPKFLRRLKEHIKMETLIPSGFYKTYYKTIGRPRGNKLESFIWFFQLQNIIGIADDAAFIRVLLLSRELREFCGFKKVPKPSDITTFRERFGGCIELMFLNLVALTEPICRELDSKKAGYLIYDTTGIEANVKENNPKFMNAKLSQAKKLTKKNPKYDPYKGVYALLPETAAANPNVKQQHIKRTKFVIGISAMLKKPDCSLTGSVLCAISRFSMTASKTLTPKSFQRKLTSLT